MPLNMNDRMYVKLIRNIVREVLGKWKCQVVKDDRERKRTHALRSAKYFVWECDLVKYLWWPSSNLLDFTRVPISS